MNRQNSLSILPTAEPSDLVSYDYQTFIDSFLDTLDRKPRTIEAYRKGLRRFFLWLQTNGIVEPTRATIKHYKAELMESTYKASTVSLYLTSVRCLFRELSREAGRPEINISDGIRTPSTTTEHKKDPLTADQARRLLAAIPLDTLAHKRNSAIIHTMLFEGLRTVEVSRLTVGDVHITTEGGSLNIWGKGRDYADASLPLASPALAAINLFMMDRENRDGKPKPSDPLFPNLSRNGYGKPLTTRSISGLCKEALQSIGLDSSRITAHSLRHTAATLAHENGASIEQIQQLMRHKNISTTQIYNHDTARLKAAAVSALEGAICP